MRGYNIIMGNHFVLYENARIRTLDPALPEAGAILVCNGKIHALYQEQNPVISGFGNIRRVDCRNLVMLPAFTDSHLHLLETGEQLTTIDVSGARSEDEAVEILKKKSSGFKPGEIIQGSRWGHNLWKPPQLPTKHSLDNAFPENPVFLFSKCGHLLWANSQAMKLAGITRDTPNPGEGVIDRDPETGEPTGMFKEDASDFFYDALPEASVSKKKEFLRNAVKHLNRFGIVNVHASDSVETFHLLQQLKNEPEFTLNAVVYLPSSSLDSLVASGLRSGLGDDRLRFGGLKVFVDGSLGGRTAWMHDPYDEEPENLGIYVATKETLLEVVGKANRNGIVAMTHAIGDRAIDTLLDVYEEVEKTLTPENRPPLNNRIEHFQLLRDYMLPRIKKMEFFASMQPVHIFSDWYAGNRFWGKRSRYAYAFRTARECGVPVVFGSDSPVEPVNVFWGMYAAVARKDLEGKPDEGWYPEESLTSREALEAYCSKPPGVVGESSVKGTLTPGKRADFVLCDKDPLNQSPEEWKDGNVLATIVAGETTFSEL